MRDDFLILINANRSKATRYAENVNGTFMETLTDNLGGNPGGYTYDGLVEIESALSWSEENLRSPQINCLEGWGIPAEPPDSPDNRRWMRVYYHNESDPCPMDMCCIMTGIEECYPPTRILTMDTRGKCLAAMTTSWYPFWDVDLGRPVGPKVTTQYQNVPWLIYPRVHQRLGGL